MPRNYLMLKFAQNIQEDCAHHLEAIRTGTATNYPVCAEIMLVCGCLRGRPGGLGVRSRPTARLSLSMNSWLPNGAPRRVASRMRSFQASSSKPHRNTSCQRSKLYRPRHSPQSSKPSMSSCRQWAAAVDHRYSSAAVPPAQDSAPHRPARSRYAPPPARNCKSEPARGVRDFGAPGWRSARNRRASGRRPSPG